MSTDIDKTMREAEDAIASLETMVHQKMDDAEQKIKKGIVQTAIWVLITVAIYFIWGTTWFFWVSFALNVISVAGMIFFFVLMAKAYKKMVKSDDNDFDFEEDDDEEIEYNEEQQKLETLINTLEDIGEDHGEVYDTDCREQMNEAILNAFIFEKENYVIPNTFGLYEEEGNKAVKKALETYINSMLPLTKNATPEERLEMFQDEVYSEEGESPDEFFGWVDAEDLERLK